MSKEKEKEFSDDEKYLSRLQEDIESKNKDNQFFLKLKAEADEARDKALAEKEKLEQIIREKDKVIARMEQNDELMRDRIAQYQTLPSKERQLKEYREHEQLEKEKSYQKNKKAELLNNALEAFLD